MIFSNKLWCILLGLLSISNLTTGQYQSSILHYDNNNRLVYHSDKDGNRIPDFGYAGYKNGGVELPDIPVVLVIEPVEGDNSAHIQAAINQLSAMPLNKNGHRGALLLQTGFYPVSKTIYLNSSGVVLRGSGEDSTVIYGTGTDKRSVIITGTNIWNGWNNRVAGSTSDITSEYLPVGSRTFEVENGSLYSVGDNIIIRHPSTDNWLAAVKYGETHGDDPWFPGEIDMVFNRFITKIEGNKIQVDVPLTHDFDRSLSQAYLWIYTRSSIITECGIENLTIDIETAGEFDEDHPEACAKFVGVEDSWVKDVTTKHFAEAGIWLVQSTRVTVLNSKALEPHSQITGGRRYNFYVGDVCNNVLFKGCSGTEGRHTFVSNGAATVAGAVFTQCSSTGDHTSSESHRRWGSGILWDKISFSASNTDRVLSLYNRGSYGTGHGWTGTYQVAWNISAPGSNIVVQKPPIGQNFAIGCDANVTNTGPFNPHPAGWIEGTGQDLQIESLYEAQLSERLIYGISPDAPGRLRATAYSYADSTRFVNLEWYDIALDEDYYLLERSSDGGKIYEVLAQLEKNAVAYKDSNLVQENYHYRLAAVNDIGSSAWSNIAQALGYDAPEKSDITFRVDMNAIEDIYPGGDVWLSFGDRETWYVMSDTVGNGIYNVTVPVLEGTELIYFFGYQTGPDPDTDYYDEVVPAECSDSAGYRTLMVREYDLILPAVVLEGCEEALPDGTDITDLEGATIIGSNDDYPWEGATAGAGSPDGEKIPNLIDNDISTKYLVRAEESWIDIITDHISIVTAYSITSANDIPSRDPRTWEFQGWDATIENWVTLHSVVDCPSWEERLKLKSWTFENGERYSRYRLNITAINFDPQSLMQMAELQIWGELVGPSAVDELVTTGIRIYPNPVQEYINIEFDESNVGNIHLMLFDISGKILIEKKIDGGNHSYHQLDMGQIKSGLHVLKVHTDKHTYTEKLVVD